MSQRRQPKSGSTAKRRVAVVEKAQPPRKFTLFCDEAGNAGANWLDAQQPYHVAAGWLVREAKLRDFEKVITDELSNTQAGELKGTTLLRRPAGVRRIINTIKQLGRNATPLFVIADRSFCVAGKAVETFLDPWTNPDAGWLPVDAFHQRQELWEIVSAIPSAALEQFAIAYRDPTPDGFREAAREIAAALEANSVGPWIVDGFRAAEQHAAEICEFETLSGAHGPHALAAALNTPVFLHLAKKADRIVGAAHPRARLRVVHDEIARFDRLLAGAIQSMQRRRTERVEHEGPDGSRVRLGLKHVSDFRVVGSTASPGVQAADLLASTVARLARMVRNDESWSDELHELAELTLPALLTMDDSEEPMLAGMLGHRDAIAGLLVPLFARVRSTAEGDSPTPTR